MCFKVKVICMQPYLIIFCLLFIVAYQNHPFRIGGGQVMFSLSTDAFSNSVAFCNNSRAVKGFNFTKLFVL